MARKRSSTTASASTAGDATSAAASGTAPAVSQRAGNEAAVERAGLGRGGSQAYLGSTTGELGEWLWGKAADALGFGTDETEDGLALAKQTADNLHSAHEKLDQLASAARDAGLGDVAARLAGAAGKLGKPAGLAEELGGALEGGEHLALVKRLYDTTSAMIAVDLRDPEAAAVFDAWFAAVGETGEVLAERGGAWGAVLAPFATFIKMLGEMEFFAGVKRNMRPHSWDRQAPLIDGMEDFGP